MNKLESVPLAQLLEENPQYVNSLVKRHRLSVADIKRLHVLFLDCDVDEADYMGEPDYYPRVVTIAVLLSEPVVLKPKARGAAIKNPRDVFKAAVAEALTLGRALRRLKA